MDTYLELREKIEDRIEEIDNYYELNFDKPNSKYFERGRMKLKKLLMYEPSTVNEMDIGINIDINNQRNLALIVNDINKNTNESNLSNNNNNYENKEEILYKQIQFSPNKKKKAKPKFMPLKEKKWKNRSVEVFEKNKSTDNEEEINGHYNKYASKKNFIKNNNSNNIFINKQSNLFIKNNYNLYGDYKANKFINKYKK